MESVVKAYMTIAAFVFYHAFFIMIYQAVCRYKTNSSTDNQRFEDAMAIAFIAIGSALLVAVLDFLLKGYKNEN